MKQQHLPRNIKFRRHFTFSLSRWTKFKDLFLAAADQCIPSFTLKRKRAKSWLSDEALLLCRKKRRVYRAAKHSQNPKHQHLYKTLCNTVRRLTRRDRNLYVTQKLQKTSIRIRSHSGAGLRTPKEAITPSLTYTFRETS